MKERSTGDIESEPNAADDEYEFRLLNDCATVSERNRKTENQQAETHFVWR